MAKKDQKPGSKIRARLKKHHQGRTRKGDLTRDYELHQFEQEDTEYQERVSGKGELTRQRTVIGTQGAGKDDGLSVQLDVDVDNCLQGRVLSVHGQHSIVKTSDGAEYQCTVRGLLKNLSTDQRNVIVAGDRVLLQPDSGKEGMIVRIEPRRGIISRTSRGRQHVIVANVDHLLIVTSAAEPDLKPNLIDRMIISAEKSRIQPIICINKVDLVDSVDLQPLVGSYAQLGYQVLLLSVVSGRGCQQLKELLSGQESVLAGQSGVGKSSLLNKIAPHLDLRVNEVSHDTQKGKHTTSAARLLSLPTGGYVVDTPGIRQFQLWDVIPEEVPGFFRDLRTVVNKCQFPDCTHTHELHCAVKDGVADGLFDVRRYESYCQIMAMDED
jgi:ribosome biogenesis GTPase